MPEFRALWLAELGSVAGDQLAAVALALIVFDRTSSAGLAALTYATTMLPALVSGVFLAGLADRFPRRAVMNVCDLTRAAVVAVMAVPGVPIPVLIGLLIMVQLGQAPHSAAQSATMAVIFPEEEALAQAASAHQIAWNTALIGGFGASGVLVAAIGPRLALIVDVATFLISALLIRFGVAARPAPNAIPDTVTHDDVDAAHPTEQLPMAESQLLSYLRRIRGGARLIIATPLLRTLAAAAWLAAFTVVPEALAIPYVAQQHLPADAIGPLMAADPVGMLVGAALVSYLPAPRRTRALGPLMILSLAPLAAFVVRPGLAFAIGLLVVVGACASYNVIAQPTFVRAVDDEHRGQALGFVGAGLQAVQGVGAVVFGFIAGWTTPALAICSAGVLGVVLAVGVAAAWNRYRPAAG